MRLVLLATLALAAASAAHASSFASSAADAGSSASGSVSDSFKASSNSSNGGDRRAEGRYRVTEVAQADAGKLRLTLAREGAANANDTVELTLPQQALAARAVHVGDEVQATPQPYGTAFAHADTGQAFFLVLEDAWARELSARVVKP